VLGLRPRRFDAEESTLALVGSTTGEPGALVRPGLDRLFEIVGEGDELSFVGIESERRRLA
jgi:hypothetical protein